MSEDRKLVLAPPAPALKPGFFERDTLEVARDLIGCRLLRYFRDGRGWMDCVVVETEAYTAEDPACHAFNRKTGRAANLYGHPGTAYVYLIYGIYNCLNVVTEPHGTAGAVLFRAVEPPVGSGLRTAGPGLLAKALELTVDTHNGLPMTDPASGLYLASGNSVPDRYVIQTTRIGITKAADFPWRFYLKDNPWVSRK